MPLVQFWSCCECSTVYEDAAYAVCVNPKCLLHRCNECQPGSWYLTACVRVSPWACCRCGTWNEVDRVACRRRLCHHVQCGFCATTPRRLVPEDVAATMFYTPNMPQHPSVNFWECCQCGDFNETGRSARCENATCRHPTCGSCPAITGNGPFAHVRCWSCCQCGTWTDWDWSRQCRWAQCSHTNCPACNVVSRQLTASEAQTVRQSLP